MVLYSMLEHCRMVICMEALHVYGSTGPGQSYKMAFADNTSFRLMIRVR